MAYMPPKFCFGPQVPIHTIDKLVPSHIGLLMLLEQGDDPTIGQEPMIAIFQPVQHSYEPVSNIFFPPRPKTMGVANPFHEFSLLDYLSTRLVDFRQL